MAACEATRHPHGRVHQFEFNGVQPIIHDIERRSLHRDGMLVGLEVWQLPDGVVRFTVLGLSATKLDPKRLESHDSLLNRQRFRCATLVYGTSGSTSIHSKTAR